MNDLLDMIANNDSPAEISDAIKDLLFAKASEKIDEFRPEVANRLFSEPEDE